MTRDELCKVIAKCTHTTNTENRIIDAVDAYTSALLKQCSVSGQPKDQLISNSSIQQLLAKIHDNIEGRYNLDVADLQDVEVVLVACQ